VCAGRGARLIGAIGAVAVIVIELLDFEFDGRIRDASECLGVLVVFCNCISHISIRQLSTCTIQSQLRSFGVVFSLNVHSGPTPRGLDGSEAAFVVAASSGRSRESVERYLLPIVRLRSCSNSSS
jgi:hypothetical protein